MKKPKICPFCGSVMVYNPHLNRWVCPKCSYVERHDIPLLKRKIA